LLQSIEGRTFLSFTFLLRHATKSTWLYVCPSRRPSSSSWLPSCRASTQTLAGKQGAGILLQDDRIDPFARTAGAFAHGKDGPARGKIVVLMT
jgi:hypothetical protein